MVNFRSPFFESALFEKVLKGIKDDTNDLKLTQYAYEELNFHNLKKNFKIFVRKAKIGSQHKVWKLLLKFFLK